jgi:protein-S-isoprenylcysteine O-methyltransferase Ste14
MKNKISVLLEKSYIDLIFALVIFSFILIYYWEFNFIKIMGIFLLLSGFVIWIVARIQLGKSFQIKPEAKQLVTSGIYSRIRHPIYLGGISVVIGGIIYTIGTLLSILLIVYLFFLVIIQYYRVKYEERVLELKFKNKYIQYKKRTWF